MSMVERYFPRATQRIVTPVLGGEYCRLFAGGNLSRQLTRSASAKSIRHRVAAAT